MEMCRVRVLHERVAADLALPAELPLVDLLPDLVDLIVHEDGEVGSRPWQLVHPVRGPLPADASLARVGVTDGATLLLDDAPRPPPVIVEDVAEAVGEALAARGHGPGRVLARATGTALLAGGAVVLVARGPVDASTGALAAIVAVFLALLAAIVARLPELGAGGTALAIAAVPWWAAAGTGLATGHEFGLAMGALAAAGTAVGALAALATPGTLRLAPGLFLAGAAIAGELALFDRPGHSNDPVAAAAVILIVVGLALLPRAAVAGSGLALVREGSVDDQQVGHRVRLGRELQEWSQGGLLVALLPAAVALAAADRPATTVLGWALAVVLAGKARRASSAADAVPLAMTAAVTAGIIGFGLARAHPGTGMGLASAALVAGGALVLGATFARP
ncbi:MAG TPA: EsaB/YukD family protein, partial [Acidimicrobiia bacterium]|nr:EsaB/YukD family protein [Acidimicrobiia bacterium]